ncbi:MAG: hypothetical protein KIG14_02505 [Candidatus Sacchiramonaceae bacterium]|jgi:hypothetical protein|nr:hypothetical protein [Candidatus Saccharimonadaceae bacterium]
MKKNQLIFFGLVGLLVVSLSFNIFLAVNNWNKPRVGKICGGADIERLNTVLESEDFSVDKVKEISDDVEGRSGNREDANCVAISLISNQIQDNADDFKSDINTLKELDQKGASPSLKFDVTYSFSELESFTEGYTGGRG